MKIGIYGAGDFVKEVDRDIDYIAVDGGLAYLNQLGIQPTYFIGDFDSFDESKLQDTCDFLKLPHVKDDTDTKVAIEYAISQGYDEIICYGLTGGRLDHFISSMRLLVSYPDTKITLVDNLNKMYILPKGRHTIYKDGYEFISFYAISSAHISVTGVFYPLENYLLEYTDTLCISNEILLDSCQLICDDMIYVIQSNSKEN